MNANGKCWHLLTALFIFGVLMGYAMFRDHMEKVHGRMGKLDIPHVYENGQKRTHNWNSGWFPEAVRELMNLRGVQTGFREARSKLCARRASRSL